VSVPEAVESAINGALQRGADQVEITSGRPATLVKGQTRLPGGKDPITGEDLEEWLEPAVSQERWLAFQLGDDLNAEVEVAGGRYRLKATREGGLVHVGIEIRPASAGARGGKATRTARRVAVPRTELERPLDRFLRQLVELGGSDLHLAAGCPPMIRLHGEMQAFPGSHLPLASEHILMMCDEIAPAANRSEFRERNDTDLAYEIQGVARFRVNFYRDRKGCGAVFRQIPHKLLTFDELGLPDSIKSLCMLSKGLVLVTGPTGSGKSTTLATMVDYVNQNRSDHIITIEDPIEFVHENKRCLVNQRQVHMHTESFKQALRAALREDPDVVLVGELRDLETMAIAIETAETGHLVFGTLHTTTAVSTVDRIIDQFPADRQAQIRVMLSESIKGVISQVLLKRRGGGRVAAFEILMGVPAIANLVREGKTFQIATVMQTNRKVGMRMMNDSLADLVKRGLVDADEAMAKSVDKDSLRSLLKSGSGESGKESAKQDAS